MSRETLERLARELAKELPLTAADWEAVIAQAERMRQAIDTLGELPLEGVEPANSIESERA